MVGEVAGHQIDVLGQTTPRPRHAFYAGLAAQASFRADFARYARHFGREGRELVDHRVDGVFELQDFAAYVDGDLLRQVTVGHGGRHLGDVAHLVGEVAGHQVHVFGEPAPGA